MVKERHDHDPWVPPGTEAKHSDRRSRTWPATHWQDVQLVDLEWFRAKVTRPEDPAAPAVARGSSRSRARGYAPVSSGEEPWTEAKGNCLSKLHRPTILDQVTVVSIFTSTGHNILKVRMIIFCWIRCKIHQKH